MLGALLAACGEEPRPAPDVHRLALDVHVTIGGRGLTLPFAALEDHAYRGMSFSLDRDGDRERAGDAADRLLKDAGNPDRPMPFRALSIVVRTYGWNDADMRQREMCPLLTHDWARSVCDNPWSAIQQALPANRFKLIDLTQLSEEDASALFNCVSGSNPLRSLPAVMDRPVIICRAVVHPMSGNEFHQALVRIDGGLGALWTVWGHGQNGEPSAVMADREGKAIASFVRNALGASENFPKLHEDMCRLRRPGSNQSPKGADCVESEPQATH